LGNGIAASGRHITGLGLVGLYCLAIGLVLMLPASLALVSRRMRGTDSTAVRVRASERMARPQLKLGGGLAVAGAVAMFIWWAALR
jgi:hypothetical protein